MNQYRFHQVISGKAKGLGPAMLRLLLRAMTVGYGLGVYLRNHLYNAKILKTHGVSCPVICVGNLTTGGTGKTPLVTWLCHYLTQTHSPRRLHCAILTRGYKNGKNRTDETALLAKNCNVRIVVNPDRVAGARQAMASDTVDVLVMDDGFQHRRIDRDLDIVAIDATNPFGFNRLLPAGLLREPVSALKRTQSVVMTRCDQVSVSSLDELERNLVSINETLVIARCIHAPVKVGFLDGSESAIQTLKDKRIFAFCGIGNPEAFFATVRETGATIVGTRAFNDHYHCTRSDLDALHRQALAAEAEMLLTTEKNLFDVQNTGLSLSLPIGYLSIVMRFIAGEDRLKELIHKVLEGKITRH